MQLAVLTEDLNLVTRTRQVNLTLGTNYNLDEVESLDEERWLAVRAVAEHLQAARDQAD